MSDNEKLLPTLGNGVVPKELIYGDNTQQEIEALKAHIERLREAGKEQTNHTRGKAVLKILKETPAQSLQEIEQRVRRDTIERCAEVADKALLKELREYGDVKTNNTIVAIRNLLTAYPRE